MVCCGVIVVIVNYYLAIIARQNTSLLAGDAGLLSLYYNAMLMLLIPNKNMKYTKMWSPLLVTKKCCSKSI